MRSIKKLISVLIAFAWMVIFMGCASGVNYISPTIKPQNKVAKPTSASTEKPIKKTETKAIDEDKEINIVIKIGDKKFNTTLYNNDSTKAFIKQMPLTINMSELNGNEKYYYMSDSLPTDLKPIKDIHTGDLMLYGSDCLVLFYEDFKSTYSYTKLGYVEDVSGFADALGNGEVKITFE